MGSTNSSYSELNQPDLTEQNNNFFELLRTNNIKEITNSINENPKIVNIKNKDVSPLIFVMNLPDVSFDLIKLLVSNGASVNSQTNNGITALNIAIFRKLSFKIINYLLENKANPDLEDTFLVHIIKLPANALIYACFTDNLKVTKRLVNNYNMQINNNHLDVACSQTSYKVGKYILQTITPTYQQLVKLCGSGTNNNLYKFVNLMLSKNIIISNSDALDNIVVHQLDKKFVSIIEKLIPDNIEKEIYNPIFSACYSKCDYEIIEILIKAGYEINRIVFNTTAICHASKYSNEVVKLLIDNGAKYNMTSYDIPSVWI